MPANHSVRSDTAPRGKAVLFCPDCGHESGITGDWNVSEERGRRRFECPACGAHVTDRPPILSPLRP